MRWVWWIVVVLLGCGGTPAPSEPEGAPRLLILSSMIGYIEPCGCTIDLTLGGIDRTLTVVEAERKLGPTAVLLVGSTFFGFEDVPDHLVPQEEAKAKLLARSLNRIGVKVYVPGPWDTGQGQDFFEARAKELGAPQTATVLDLGGTKVGVLPVTAADAQAVATEAAALREQGATVVVALAPIPRPDLRGLAKQVDAVDLWVLGDHPKEESALSPAGSGYIVEAGDRGRNLGRLVLHDADTAGRLSDPAGDAQREAKRLKLKLDMLRMRHAQSKDPAVKAQIKEIAAQARAAETPAETGKRVEYTLMPIEKSVAQDPTIKQWIAEFNASLPALNLEVAGTIPPVPEGKSAFAGGAQCIDCHEEAQKVWEATPHARAWQTLVDAGKTFDAECVGCHVAGWLMPGGSALGKTEKLQDVQCEACHGPGEKHVELGGDEYWTKRLVPSAVCETCHNEHHSPKYDYETYLPKVLGPGHEARKD